MYQTVDRPRYVAPGLGSVDAALDRYSWPLVRVATGLFFAPHVKNDDLALLEPLSAPFATV